MARTSSSRNVFDACLPAGSKEGQRRFGEAAAGVVHGLTGFAASFSLTPRVGPRDAGQAGLGDRRGRGCRRPRGALRLLTRVVSRTCGYGVGVGRGERRRTVYSPRGPSPKVSASVTVPANVGGSPPGRDTRPESAPPLTVSYPILSYATAGAMPVVGTPPRDW